MWSPICLSVMVFHGSIETLTKTPCRRTDKRSLESAIGMLGGRDNHSSQSVSELRSVRGPVSQISREQLRMPPNVDLWTHTHAHKHAYICTHKHDHKCSYKRIINLFPAWRSTLSLSCYFTLSNTQLSRRKTEVQLRHQKK